MKKFGLYIEYTFQQLYKSLTGTSQEPYKNYTRTLQKYWNVQVWHLALIYCENLIKTFHELKKKITRT
jgi:hypothetical protein